MIAGGHVHDTALPTQPPSARGYLAAGLGAITAAFLASLCCIGPVLFVTLGVGAGLASQFEPLRPLFTVLTLVLLAIGFYAAYGRRAVSASGACMTDSRCATARDHTRDRIVLWSATVVAVIVLTFPQWSLLFV